MLWNCRICFAVVSATIVLVVHLVDDVNAFTIITRPTTYHVPLRTTKASLEVPTSSLQKERRINLVTTSLNGKIDDDTEDGRKKTKSTTILDGKPPNEKRYYTYEELESNPELYEIERRQSQRIESLWITIPSVVSQVVTAAAWFFIASTLILQSQGYGWIVDHSTNPNRIYIDTLEQRDFINTLYKNERDVNEK